MIDELNTDGPDWGQTWQRAHDLLKSRFARGWQPSDWKDMAQDVVVKAIIAYSKGQLDVLKLPGWLPVVAKRVANDYYRSARGRHGSRRNESLGDAGDDLRTEGDIDQILASIDVQMLMKTTELLPVERVALVLTYWHNLTSEEIAEVLGGETNASTVRGWLRIGRNKLRARAARA